MRSYNSFTTTLVVVVLITVDTFVRSYSILSPIRNNIATNSKSQKNGGGPFYRTLQQQQQQTYISNAYKQKQQRFRFSTTTTSQRQQLSSSSNNINNELVKTIKKEVIKTKLSNQGANINWETFEKSLDNCKSASQARRILNERLGTTSEQSSYYYNSVAIPRGASSKGISDGDLAIQTRLGNKKYKITELIELNGNRDIDRASVAILCVTISSVITSIFINQNLQGPDIIRFVFVWLITFAPLVLIGYGLQDIDQLQTILVTIQRNLLPKYRKRMIQHEAGHFLIGHLLGWPVANYQANAIKNAVEFYPLSDSDVGRSLAQQLGFDKPIKSTSFDSGSQSRITYEDVPFFSSEGRGALFVEESSVFQREKNYTEYTSNNYKLSSQNEPTNAWPYRGFDDVTLDQLTAISVAGVCSEILAFGNAEGGVADLAQLKLIFNSAQNEISDKEQENRIRYSLGYTISLLRRNLGVLDDLADVMECGGSVAECVRAIETCKNPTGENGISNDYEIRRRKAFRSEGLNFVELLFLGDDKNIDTDENRLVQGKGGGDRKETFRLTGDDPFYLAIGCAFVFLAWASNGGLSLH